MKQKYWLSVASVFLLLLSCKKELYQPEKASPHPIIAVVSDIHYMDPSLLINGAADGEAFQTYLAQDPKLLQYSSQVLQRVVEDLKKVHPDLLLVPGDLTKDGEIIDHKKVAAYLEQLRSSGTKVYVLPGNHDINNAKAMQFDGNTATPLSRTQVADFTNIYKNFGYDNATEKDPASLSYLAKPYSDLWILAIDASEYEMYGPEGDVANGRIKDATMNWILAKIAEARRLGITLFAMMHHNLVEHYAGQTTIDPGYVVDNSETRVRQLMDAGLTVIFTGHYHASDVTPHAYNGNELFDIETGSLVTYPHPYRVITVKSKKLEIRTTRVEQISATLPHGLSFAAYAQAFLSGHLDAYFNYYLTHVFGAPAALSAFAAPLFRNAYMAHLAGDEKMPPDQQAQINVLAGMSPQLAGIATTFWTDLGVADNDVTIRYEK